MLYLRGELVLRVTINLKTVQKRLSVYHAQTQPLIDYYKKANVLVEVTEPRISTWYFRI